MRPWGTHFANLANCTHKGNTPVIQCIQFNKLHVESERIAQQTDKACLIYLVYNAPSP